jgi:hypothetical protein
VWNKLKHQKKIAEKKTPPEKKRNMTELVATYPVRCQNHINPDNMARFSDHLDRWNSSASVPVDPTQILSLNIVYVVIPLAPSGDLSVERIQAQHTTMNKYFYQFSGGFPSGMLHYPYDQSFGNPYIQFAPQDSTDVTEAKGLIVRLKTPASAPASGYSDPTQCQAEFIAQGNTVKAGTLYVYLTSLASSGGGTLLGQAADIIANYAMIHYGTVGSVQVPGAFQDVSGMENYAHGMTMVHEVGHCLGLYHPFSGSACTSSDTQFIHTQTPQTPVQANPNFGGEVFLSNLTAPNANAWDNAGRDYLRSQNVGCFTITPPTTCGLKNGDDASAKPYSCLDAATLSDPHAAWECPFNIMDYADDTTMLGFLSFNANTMRTVLLNNPQLFSVQQIAPSSDAASPTPTPTLTVVTPSSTPTSFWTTTNIAIVVVCAVLGAVLLAAGMFLWLRRRRRTHETRVEVHSHSHAYHGFE